jgi:hypothetical protein
VRALNKPVLYNTPPLDANSLMLPEFPYKLNKRDKVFLSVEALFIDSQVNQCLDVIGYQTYRDRVGLKTNLIHMTQELLYQKDEYGKKADIS